MKLTTDDLTMIAAGRQENVVAMLVACFMCVRGRIGPTVDKKNAVAPKNGLFSPSGAVVVPNTKYS